jgi:MIP family channel proteins
VQDRGLAAYIAELIGTFFLVFFITTVVTLFVATGNQAQFGSDFAVIGLVHTFVLFGLVVIFGAVSGGHFNPAVTVAVAFMRRIDPIDALVYILAQLSGGVLGALATKWLLLDEGRAGHYGAVKVSGLLGSPFQGAVIEAFGTFVLVLVILTAVFSIRGARDWAPFAIGAALGLVVMVGGPLTGGSFNPARWFGPALVANSFNGFAGIWPYIVGPMVGATLAAVVFRFVVEAGATPGPAPSPSEAGASVSGAISSAAKR